MARRTRHISTIDTREQEIIEGKGWRGVPGTGEALPCHCCGKAHEIHALIAIDETADTIPAKWHRVATLNYGVSCARKVATVHAGTVARQFDRATYARLIAVARTAAEVAA